MSGGTNLRATGDRIEQLLDELQVTADPRTVARAEELLRLVTELYGGALAKVLDYVQADPQLFGLLVNDELVGSILLVHGLHPDSLDARVERALASVRPILATHHGDVELLEVDAHVGAVRLRLLGSCDGCPSSSETLENAVKSAIIEAAPEVAIIDVDSSVPDQPDVFDDGSIPISISTSRRPVYDSCPTELAVT
ncbi:MAG: NifU family protein [Acidimicrobiia bacterium]